MAVTSNKKLTTTQQEDLLSILKARFEKNMKRHPGLDWTKVRARLTGDPGKLWSLSEMERTGGEPDVVGFDNKTGAYIFFDCSPESPAGRRSFCYDPEALASRKENKPKNSVIGMAGEMGIELLNESQYKTLQALGQFDQKSSSWLATPEDIRQLGGAIFGDYRYGKVFVYHNGADSYYAARGFRGALTV